MNINDYKQSRLFVNMFVSKWWSRNEERVREWIEERLNFRIEEGTEPGYDEFEEEFPFTAMEEDSIGFMLNEHMDFLDQGDIMTIDINAEFERNFEKLVDEVVAEREEMKQEYAMFA